MSDDYYLSRNPSPDGDIVDFQSNRDDSLAFMCGSRDENFTVATSADVRLQQSRCINQNNQRLLTWDILLNDDQDEVSQNFLRMYYEPIIVSEKFGSDILMVPENIRKQADELFKPSEINPSEFFDLLKIKDSWILPSIYQQYLKSIPKNEKEKRHVLYPWMQWNDTGARPSSGRPPNSVTASPAASSDRSSLSSSQSLSLSSSSSVSSSSSLYTLAATMYGWSPHSSFNNDSNNNNNNNNNLNNSGSSSNNNNNNNNINNISNNNWPFGFFDEMECGLIAAADCTSPAGDPSCSFGPAVEESPTVLFQTTRPRAQQQRPYTPQQRPVQANPWAAGLYDDHDDRPSPPPEPPFAHEAAAAGAARHWPTRLFYCVSTDSNTINKLVEHYCTFCYKNQEPPEVYGSHLVRDAVRITCPKLRALRCKHCNGTGDNAHTVKYCPFVYANYS